MSIEIAKSIRSTDPKIFDSKRSEKKNQTIKAKNNVDKDVVVGIINALDVNGMKWAD